MAVRLSRAATRESWVSGVKFDPARLAESPSLARGTLGEVSQAFNREAWLPFVSLRQRFGTVCLGPQASGAGVEKPGSEARMRPARVLEVEQRFVQDWKPGSEARMRPPRVLGSRAALRAGLTHRL